MRIALALITVACLPASARADAPFSGMLQLELSSGERFEGMPLDWNAQWIHLLGRDGRVWRFAPDEAVAYRKSAERFRCFSPAVLRNQLLAELGKDFEVSGTGHYLVAHRRGDRDKWAGRFEELYRSFVQYFTVRGFTIEPPPFPLIGIVCRNQQEFARFSARQGVSVSAGVLGYYDLDTNRILVYDTGSAAGADDWHRTAGVIIHEATHQTAFNTGLHGRFTPPPLWVVEGLATLFEAPGVYDSRHYTRRSDRINRARLDDFRRGVQPRHRPEAIQSLVASDNLFRTNPGAAYAEAWALTFYLAETQPGRWAQYVARTAAYPPFTEVTAQQRTADFAAVFGEDWRMFEAQFLRFMAGVK